MLALAREIGMLRLRLGPAAALEISHEGPEVGGTTGLIDRFRLEPENEFALAVFTSVGCHVCRVLAPAVDSLRNEPALSVATFEESADSEVWEALGIPGAPYAIAMDPSGTVLAKGTFNNLAHLESVVATAERRQTERIGSKRWVCRGGPRMNSAGTAIKGASAAPSTASPPAPTAAASSPASAPSLQA